MRKKPVLGLAGLILTGIVGCETNRPYCSHCTPVRDHFAQAEAPYRPKTVVTMRAEEVPENPVALPGSTCPTVQLVGATAAPVAQAPSQTPGSAPMVTLTIPAMKIVIPMTASMSTPSGAAKETTTVTQLPATVSSVVQASSTATIASSSSSPKRADAEVHQAVHVQKEEAASSSSMTSSPPSTSTSSSSKTSASTSTETPPQPEPVPEPKPKSKAAKKENDAAKLPRLSLLPPDPPPDVPMHRTSSPASALRTPEPPPPPPIPKSSSSSGPILPSDDSEPR